MTIITIHYPEGELAYTDHVDGASAHEEIAGGGHWADEAEALIAFGQFEELPTCLLGRYWLVESNERDRIPFARYRED